MQNPTSLLKTILRTSQKTVIAFTFSYRNIQLKTLLLLRDLCTKIRRARFLLDALDMSACEL